MALTKFLARDLKIEIADPASGGSFVEVKGLNTLSHSPKTTEAPTTDFNSGGHAEHLVAERSEEWTLDGYKLLDPVTGDQDPGQVLVEALAAEISYSSLGTFKITDPAGDTETFTASAEITRPGGGLNDAAKWAAKLSISGQPVFA